MFFKKDLKFEPGGIEQNALANISEKAQEPSVLGKASLHCQS